MSNKLISVILPCRNEEEALPKCLQTIQKIIAEQKLNAEIIVSDSSVDSSPKIALDFGVILVKHDQEGYGRAYLEGFQAAKGDFFFIADCDGTYDFAEIPNFIKFLQEGYDFVIGNRLKGKIDKGAMPWLHRYVGSPVLNFIFRLFFRRKIGDINCGMRAFTKESLQKMKLKTAGMEFASEMIIKAVKKDLHIKEVIIDYHTRLGKSKLKTFADGWRHLRFMLLYSPGFLFLVPGLFLFFFGAGLMSLSYFNKLSFAGLNFYYHPMFFACLFLIVGYQLLIFAVFAKTYAITHLGEQSKTLDKIHKIFTIEKAGLIGLFLAITGLLVFVSIFYKWWSGGFTQLQEVKNLLIALTLASLGFQTIFSSFMLSILGIKER
ncbi:MAG TPA: glycosyltransferase family 2 protein [Candidatus Magasanikbacteria bacterium]|nr:glycosyltransferase family 2 protein [Candidatus Magasanikbacteria bacterium]